MKNQLTRTLAGFFAVAALSLASCEKDEVKATLTPDSTPTLSASTSSVVLAQTNGANTAVTYTWTPISGFTWGHVENTYNPSVSYSFQVDKQGNNFTAPVSIDAGAGPTTTLTVEQLNSSLITLGLAPGTATPLDVRLRATYAANAPMYSPVVPLTATSYKVCVPPNSDKWGIVGPAANGWPSDPPAVQTDAILTYDCDLKAYTLTRDMKADEFKFRKNTSWAVNLGSVKPKADGASLEQGGDNIKITEAGNYTITLYPNATPKPTYTLKKN